MKTNLLQTTKKGIFVILPTFQCNVRCEHCFHSCSPKLTTKMPIELFRSCVLQAIELGWKTLCLSGGEVFLLPDHLAEISDICLSRGVELNVQSNGFWGKDLQKARELVAKFEGITQMGFSIDSAHLKYIGLETVLNAVTAALEQYTIKRISVSVSYKTFKEFGAIKQMFNSHFPVVDVVGWPILPLGRAARNPNVRGDYVACSWRSLQRNCSFQLELSPIVHPNGDVHACYRPVMVLEERDPLLLGNLTATPLESILSSVDNRLLLFMIAYGPGGLGYLLQDSSYEWILEEPFTGVCHFCHSLLSRRDLVDYVQELLGDRALIARSCERITNREKASTNTRKNAKHRILICNGKNCGRNQKNYAIIHYLMNQLVDLKATEDVEISFVNCLNACKYGPNIYIKNTRTIVQSADLDAVDRILSNLVSVT